MRTTFDSRRAAWLLAWLVLGLVIGLPSEAGPFGAAAGMVPIATGAALSWPGAAVAGT